MADLLQMDTDEEIDKYDEATLIASNPPPLAATRDKMAVYNPLNGRNDVLVPLSLGGYVKLGEEPVDRLAEVRKYADELQQMEQPFDMADYEAAGFTQKEVEDAGIMPVTQEKTGRTEPLREGEELRMRREGAAMVTPDDPTMRQDLTRLTFENTEGDLRQIFEVLGIDRFTARKMAEGLWGNPESTRDLGLGIADFTPAGLFFGAQEGMRTFERGRNTGDPLTIGMGALEAGLSFLEALPLTAAGAKGLKASMPVMRNALTELGRRMNQPGDMPTTSSFGAGPIDDAISAAGPQRPVGSYVNRRADGDANEAARNRVLEISQAKGNKKPKIEDLVDFFEEEHVNIYGRKLDPTSDQDFDVAVDAAADEIQYQMDQSVSGRGWYDEDVNKTFLTLSKVSGLEDLANNETLRIIWSAFAAPTSIGNKVDLNTRAATAAFLQYLKTGKVPVNPPAAGATTEGIKGAGWGRKQQSVGAGMKVISHLIDELGPEGFADWWLSPHTLKELTDVRKAAGLSGGPSGLSGGKDSVHLGAMVLGDKTGRYSLNINGYKGTTKDVWFSRSYNRHFGDMRNPDGSIAGGPRNQTERRRMEEFTARLLDRIRQEGLSEQDAQAILWFYEQNLFTDLGVVSRPGSFSEASEKILNDLRSGVRAGDEAKAGDEQAGERLAGFREVSPTKRAIRAERRPQVAGGRAEGDIRKEPIPYTRGSVEGDEGDGLLEFTPDPAATARYQAAGLSTPTIRQVKAADNAAGYNSDMTEAMAGHEFGAQVEIKSADELANAQLFRTDNGSGFAIKSDGDIVAVFASKAEPEGGAYAMLQAAVAAGGRKLDAFDTYLPGIYKTIGFRPVARLPWNDEFAPPDWDKATFSKYNNGEPDVVMFVYDPDYFGEAVDVPVFTDYDEALAVQDAEVARLKPRVDEIFATE